jgi:hypothetical protein
VKTFNETHVGPFGKGPTYEVRERRWREAFQMMHGSWFCFVIEGENGELIGRVSRRVRLAGFAARRVNLSDRVRSN